MGEVQAENIIPVNLEKYKNEFDELEQIGKGGFGTVYKVREKLTNNIFAIKTIWFNNPNQLKQNLREVRTNLRVKSEFTVDFINAWRGKHNVVFIQMELCKDSLINVLENKPDAFGRHESEPMSSLEYFISFQLLIELSECLNFIHTLTPPIMHRDLNPKNILISDGQSGRFLKLCDFGLAKDYLKSSDQTGNLGTDKYIAWEVKAPGDRVKYNYKSDIFSLAVIALEIFSCDYRAGQLSIDCSNLLSNYLDTNLENNFRQLLDYLAFCVAESTPYAERPTCADFLKKVNELSIDESFVLSDRDYENNLQKLIDSKNEFFINYSKTELAIS